MAFDFGTLSADNIFEYMEEHATAKQKKEFKKEAFITQGKKIGIEVKDENGNPVMYQVMDKHGNPKLDKHGNPLMRKKLRYVEQKGIEEKLVFSLLKGKWWFAEQFPEAVENVPERAKDKVVEKASDRFKNW